MTKRVDKNTMVAFYENKGTVIVTGSLLLYFLWMDIALFYHVNSRTVVEVTTVNPPPTTPSALFSPFTGLSVKMMMMDPINNYIFTPLAHIFNEVTRFSQVFYFITPNMVSFMGLVFAVAAGKCMCYEGRIYHCLAIALFQGRTWFDALDGIVARSRIGMVQHVSLRNTSGYVVDGVADALGFTAFLIGCFQYLRTALPKHKYYLPISLSEFSKEGNSCSNGVPSQNGSHSNHKRVLYVVACFGVQMAIGAFFWDHYIDAYHNLLETNAPTPQQTVAQNEVLKSSITWILMWFWRLSNAHTFIQFLLFAIYINRLWDFLTWIQYVGFVQILTLAFFTELHLSTVRTYVLGFT